MEHSIYGNCTSRYYCTTDGNTDSEKLNHIGGPYTNVCMYSLWLWLGCADSLWPHDKRGDMLYEQRCKHRGVLDRFVNYIQCV